MCRCSLGKTLPAGRAHANTLARYTRKMTGSGMVESVEDASGRSPRRKVWRPLDFSTVSPRRSCQHRKRRVVREMWPLEATWLGTPNTKYSLFGTTSMEHRRDAKRERATGGMRNRARFVKLVTSIQQNFRSPTNWPGTTLQDHQRRRYGTASARRL